MTPICVPLPPGEGAAKRRVRGCALALLLIALPAAAAKSDLESTFRQDVKLLASDRMEGRGLGTQGLERAGDWIESQLRATLKPAFPDHSYRQPFRVKTGV